MTQKLQLTVSQAVQYYRSVALPCVKDTECLPLAHRKRDEDQQGPKYTVANDKALKSNTPVMSDTQLPKMYK